MTFVQFDAKGYCGLLGGQTSPSFVLGIWYQPGVLGIFPVVERAAFAGAEDPSEEKMLATNVDTERISVVFFSTSRGSLESLASLALIAGEDEFVAPFSRGKNAHFGLSVAKWPRPGLWDFKYSQAARPE